MEPESSQPQSQDSQQPQNPQAQPTVASVVPETPAAAVAPPRRRRPLLAIFLLLLLFGCGGIMLMLILSVGAIGSLSGKVQEEHFSHEIYSSNKVAIINVRGTILSGEGFVKKQIDQAKKDDNIKAIVLRVNSPGGTVTGSDYIYHHLTELRKEKDGVPIVVSMGSLAASGGYYVAMACGDTHEKVIYAEPTTWTGSIGVKIPHYDLSKFLNEKLDIYDDTIASHELKNMGSFAKAMTDEEKAIWQALVDDAFDRFKEVIESGRSKFKKDPEALEKLATGQVFSANQAKENGLIDEIGFIEAAIDRAIELANLDKDDVTVVRYKREPTLVDVLMGANAQQKTSPELAALLELNTPKAYYLFTRLPVHMERP